MKLNAVLAGYLDHFLDVRGTWRNLAIQCREHLDRLVSPSCELQSCFKQQMKMVWDQCQGKALCLRLDDQITKPSDEKITILIVTECLAALNAPGNDMMQRTRCVNSGLSGHEFGLAAGFA
ncbi:MAG: hypothetical protein R6W95_00485 [Desulfosarcina sp.]